MSDKEVGLPPVSLAASGYDVQKLKSALDTANEAEPEDRPAAIDAALRKIEGSRSGSEQSDIAIPEGHVLATVKDAQGRKVKAAVADPDLVEVEVEVEVVVPPADIVEDANKADASS